MTKHDMIGRRFNRWFVLRADKAWGAVVARCDCGTTRTVSAFTIRKGQSKSCGCLSSEVTSVRSRKHGYTKTKTYQCWVNMRARCKYPSHKYYNLYGGRGITVCDRWLNSFESFLADMGEQPSELEIDRIDVNKGYSRENCRWATLIEQGRNRRNNVMVKWMGRTIALSELSEVTGVAYMLLYKRIAMRGWDVDRAVSQSSTEYHNRVAPNLQQFLA